MRNKNLYSLAFPVLNAISLSGVHAWPIKLGAGVFVVAEKEKVDNA